MQDLAAELIPEPEGMPILERISESELLGVRFARVSDNVIDTQTGEIIDTYAEVDDCYPDAREYRLRLDISEIVSEMGRASRMTPSVRGALVGRDGLGHKMMAAYPYSFVERLGLIATRGIRAELVIEERKRELQAILVDLVSQPGVYDSRWLIGHRRRNDSALLARVADILRPHFKQRRSRETATWLVTYLLDCCDRGGGAAFARSTRQIVDDSNGLICTPKEAAKYLSRIVDGYKTDGCDVPIFRLEHRGSMLGRRNASGACERQHRGRASAGIF